jgi:hypothetical protein
MKAFTLFVLLLVAAGNRVFAQEANQQAKQQIHQFKLKDKLKPETGEVNFRGLSKPQLQQKLNTLLNVAADDFTHVLNDEPTADKYLDNVKLGLSRFNAFYAELDTEDKTRICAYFAELMDDVSLDSPEELLNRWIQNLEPADKQ